jgi:hypothetical protein
VSDAEPISGYCCGCGFSGPYTVVLQHQRTRELVGLCDRCADAEGAGMAIDILAKRAEAPLRLVWGTDE